LKSELNIKELGKPKHKLGVLVHSFCILFKPSSKTLDAGSTRSQYIKTTQESVRFLRSEPKRPLNNSTMLKTRGSIGHHENKITSQYLRQKLNSMLCSTGSLKSNPGKMCLFLPTKSKAIGSHENFSICCNDSCSGNKSNSLESILRAKHIDFAHFWTQQELPK